MDHRAASGTKRRLGLCVGVFAASASLYVLEPPNPPVEATILHRCVVLARVVVAYTVLVVAAELVTTLCCRTRRGNRAAG